jgi:hypothetical protein
MEIKVNYKGLADRQAKAKEQEAKGLRMLHDDFDPDWKPGNEPHGTMTFTDEQPTVTPIEPARDLAKEIDDLKARIEKLEKK